MGKKGGFPDDRDALELKKKKPLVANLSLNYQVVISVTCLATFSKLLWATTAQISWLGGGCRAFRNMWEITIVLPTLPLHKLRKNINAWLRFQVFSELLRCLAEVQITKIATSLGLLRARRTWIWLQEACENADGECLKVNNDWFSVLSLVQKLSGHVCNTSWNMDF